MFQDSIFASQVDLKSTYEVPWNPWYRHVIVYPSMTKADKRRTLPTSFVELFTLTRTCGDGGMRIRSWLLRRFLTKPMACKDATVGLWHVLIPPTTGFVGSIVNSRSC